MRQPLKIVCYPFMLYYSYVSDSPRKTRHVAELLPDTTYIKQSNGMFLRADSPRGQRYISQRGLH